jgi:hypothetical protein
MGTALPHQSRTGTAAEHWSGTCFGNFLHRFDMSGALDVPEESLRWSRVLAIKSCPVAPVTARNVDCHLQYRVSEASPGAPPVVDMAEVKHLRLLASRSDSCEYSNIAVIPIAAEPGTQPSGTFDAV